MSKNIKYPGEKLLEYNRVFIKQSRKQDGKKHKKETGRKWSL